MRRRALGLVVIIAAVVAVGLLWQRPDPWSNQVTVRVDVRDASGLAAIGADVRVAGVPVGRVSSLARAGRYARLTLTVSPSAGVVHRDATVALRPRLMFEGTAYVELMLGSPGAPPLGAHVIPPAQTSTYVPLSDAMSVLRAGTRTDVHELSASAGRLLSGAAPPQLHAVVAAAPGLLHDTAGVSAAARGAHRTELRAAVGSLGRVAGALAEQSTALAASLDSASRTTHAAEVAAGAPLDATLTTLPQVVVDLRRGAGAGNAILGQLAPLIPRLDPGVRQLVPTLDAVRPLLRRAPLVERSFKGVLGDAARAVTGTRAGAAPALDAVHAVSPPLQTFRGSLLSALERPTDLGTPAYLAFLGLFAGGGGASRPFGIEGQGHFMRFGLRFLTGFGLPLPPCTLIAQVLPSLGSTLGAAGACTP
jgi:ABC-type transporter Mla subunit MlaD